MTVEAGNVIAVVAVVASLATTAYVTVQQQRGAREDRRQERLDDCYTRLADFLSRTKQFSRTAETGIDAASGLWDPELDADEWLSLRARVDAYASESVRSGFDELLMWRKRTEINLGILNRQTGRYPPAQEAKIEAKLEEARTALGERCDALLAQIRKELRSQ